MFAVAQTHTDLPGEFRVEPQDFCGEGDFVDHTLTGAMPAAEQFQIFKGIVCSIAVSVMHGFFRKQFSTNMLRHNVTMFENIFSSRLSVLRRDVQGYVFSTHAASYFWKTMFFAVYFAYPLVFALLAAKFLLGVDATAMIAMSLAFFAAIYACKFVSRFGIALSPCIRARHGAVQRFAFEFLSVRSDVGQHHRKRLVAVFADETDRRPTGGVLVDSVFAATRQAAIFAAFIGFALVTVERLLATFAQHLNRHGYVPLCGNSRDYGRVGWGCQVTL